MKSIEMIRCLKRHQRPTEELGMMEEGREAGTTIRFVVIVGDRPAVATGNVIMVAALGQGYTEVEYLSCGRQALCELPFGYPCLFPC